MASRLMHLSIGNLLTESLSGIKNANRFKLGHILPDANDGDKARDVTHFKRNVDRTKKIYDFHKFKDQFPNKLLTDPLYLGYYFHLIEDAIHRNLIYYGLNYDGNKEAKFQTLYSDYDGLNKLLIKTYGLTNCMYTPQNLENEEISKIYPFGLKKLSSDISGDFNRSSDNKPILFTKEVTEAYIQTCVHMCLTEFKEIQHGDSCLNPLDYAWDSSNV